jgi:phage baseplate assembly protein W
MAMADQGDLSTLEEEEAAELVAEETEFDLAFPILPLEDDPAPPTEDEQLVDDLDDFAGDELDDTVEDEEPSGDDWAFNWVGEEFFVDTGGDPLRVTGDDAVGEWAMKALNTPKGVYPIYSPFYGSELYRVLGQPLPDAVRNAEIHRTVIECVTRHPRVEGAEILSMSTSYRSLSIVVALQLDTGDEPVILEVST